MCAAYSQFCKDYGFEKMVYDAADERFEKIEEILTGNLMQFLTYLTYQKDKMYASHEQDEYEERIRRNS